MQKIELLERKINRMEGKDTDLWLFRNI
jgi:hypothetical protein